VTPPDWA